MAFEPGLEIGSVTKYDILRGIFKCSLGMGMNKSNTHNTLLIVSDHVKSIYQDRWENEYILNYTGMGKKGDQSINYIQNPTLFYSRTNNVDLHLFEKFIVGEYIYRGRVILNSDPYQEEQPDEEGNKRKVWMFPLKVLSKEKVLVQNSVLIERRIKKEKEAKKLNNSELEKRISYSSKKSGTRHTSYNAYERNPWVSEYAKRRARGTCQLCAKSAPFIKKDGEPFLETHHIIWLAKGGEDSIYNTVALCPNCHRKMHSLDKIEDKIKLKEAANKEIK